MRKNSVWLRASQKPLLIHLPFDGDISNSRIKWLLAEGGKKQKGTSTWDISNVNGTGEPKRRGWWPLTSHLWPLYFLWKKVSVGRCRNVSVMSTAPLGVLCGFLWLFLHLYLSVSASHAALLSTSSSEYVPTSSQTSPALVPPSFSKQLWSFQ